MSAAKDPMSQPIEKKDVVKLLTMNMLERVAAELNKPDAQCVVKNNIIDPLIRMLYSQMFPYVMVVCAVMLIILLTSLCSCTMFALFFFKAK